MTVHRIIITLFALAPVWNDVAVAQCAQLSLSLEARISLSDVIVEGRVVHQYAFEGSLYDMIYTTHIVEVFKVFAGVVTSRHIEITTPGGVLGDKAVSVSPSLELQPGARGVIMLRRHNGMPISASEGSFLLPVAATASFIETGNTDRIKDGNRVFDDPADLFQTIATVTGQAYTELNAPQTANAAKTMMMPVISTITPLTTTAGTGSTITITGSGFGTMPGIVFFDNANDGPGGSYVGTVAAHIVSWSDAQIVAAVPSNSGTGKVYVQTSEAVNSSLSSQNLTVSYGVRNVNNTALTYLVDHGTAGDGGYHFHIGTSTANNGVNIRNVSGAMTAVERAMQTIHNTVGVAIYAGENCPSTSIQTPGNDGINLLSFDSDAYDLASVFSPGTLGVTISNFSKCDISEWETVNIDVIFRRPGGVNWYFGTGNPGVSQIDFESVALHEMGHTFSLSHINNTAAVMNSSISAGATRRAFLAGADLDGAQYAHNSSLGYTPPVVNCVAPFNATRKYGAYMEAQDCSQLQVLPVELVDFDGQAEEKGVRLQWKTASELHNDYFAVEHSADGRSFREFIRVQGAGTTSVPQFYESFHSLPAAGINYYRLAQYDYDGSHTYSGIISLKFEGPAIGAIIAPNPVSGKEISLWYNSPNETQIELEIITLSGKICASQRRQVLSGNQHISLPVDGLNAGFYLLRIRNGNETQVLRFSKI